jgi:serine/threonine-protein kinase
MSGAPVQLGQVLAGKYRVDRIIGQGGMGVVVAATHLQLDEHVALKFLLPDAVRQPEVVERFAREARAASKIKSEHVARVIDVGTLETGAPYMVMEYLDGNDLAAELTKRPHGLPADEAVQYVLQALEALAEAHAIGIIHRDLKPGNLFLARRRDKSSSVKVLDFGISKVAVGPASAMTQTSSVMGSPLYMSPEQLMSAKHVDARSDIWSMGIVLYELLAGGPPYIADTMPEVVAKILQMPLPPLRQTRPGVPEELTQVVARCLAKDPAQRYANVADLARALTPFTPDGRRSYERIARVLDVSHTERPPAQGTSGASSFVTGATQRLSADQVPSLQQPSAPQMPPMARSDPQAAAWGTTQHRSKSSPLVPLLAVGALLVVGLGAFGIWFFVSHRHAPVESAATHASTTTPVVPTVAATPEPVETSLPPLTMASAPPAASSAPVGAAPPAVTRATTKPSSTKPLSQSSAVASAAPPPATTSTSTSKNRLNMDLK